MKTQSRLCRVTLLFFLHSILLLMSAAIVAAQKPGCDATVKAKLHFKELRTQFIKDRSSVDKSEFRRAARNYIRLAEQCYELTVGESASGQRIDEGGMWMGPIGATTTAPPASEDFVLFGTKWGAGSPFTGGTEATGPRLPGGTVSYSFMADGVDLTLDAPGLFNVAITSMGSFTPCLLDEIELAGRRWRTFCSSRSLTAVGPSTSSRQPTFVLAPMSLTDLLELLLMVSFHLRTESPQPEMSTSTAPSRGPVLPVRAASASASSLSTSWVMPSG